MSLSKNQNYPRENWKGINHISKKIFERSNHFVLYKKDIFL